MAPTLASVINEIDPTAVFFPMGLGNPDHVMVHDAGLLARAEQPDRAWFCYEDHGYKHIPGLLAWRVAKLLRSHPWPTPAIVAARARRGTQAQGHLVLHQPDPAAGERARALAARLDGHVPEQFWHLAPPPQRLGGAGRADLTG